MWRVVISLAAAIVLVANGVMQGYLTNRWHRSADLEMSISRLSNVPETIGDWRSTSETLEEAVLSRACIDGYVYRNYENQINGKKVTVLLMCGRSGPLSVHTPDICYRGAGFHLDGSIAP